MVITDIRTYLIELPGHGGRSALGEFKRYEYGIIFVDTDSGITGIGEISMLWDGKARTQLAFVEHYFKPNLIGQNPCCLNDCMARMNTLVEQAHPARAAVEMALLDINGKHLNIPVYQLLGGKVRDRIRLSHSIHFNTAEKMAESAKRFIDEGFTCVKVKVGVSEADDLRNVEAIRKVVGEETLIRVDANMSWKNVKTAIHMSKQLKQYCIHSVEQPMPPATPVEDLALVRRSVDVPIMADESVWGPESARRMLDGKAYDMFNVYVAEAGGLLNSQFIFKIAEMEGVGCVIGAMPEMGIGTAAQIHLGLSAPNLVAPCDACGAIYLSDDVINESFTIKDGHILPLEGPGLGVSINFQKFEKYLIKQ